MLTQLEQLQQEPQQQQQQAAGRQGLTCLYTSCTGRPLRQRLSWWRMQSQGLQGLDHCCKHTVSRCCCCHKRQHTVEALASTCLHACSDATMRNFTLLLSAAANSLPGSAHKIKELVHHTCCCLQITSHFEGLPGKRMPIKGESAEYSLEVVKYDKGSKGEKRMCAHC